MVFEGVLRCLNNETTTINSMLVKEVGNVVVPAQVAKEVMMAEAKIEKLFVVIGVSTTKVED